MVAVTEGYNYSTSAVNETITRGCRLRFVSERTVTTNTGRTNYCSRCRRFCDREPIGSLLCSVIVRARRSGILRSAPTETLAFVSELLLRSNYRKCIVRKQYTGFTFRKESSIISIFLATGSTFYISAITSARKISTEGTGAIIHRAGSGEGACRGCCAKRR